MLNYLGGACGPEFAGRRKHAGDKASEGRWDIRPRDSFQVSGTARGEDLFAAAAVGWVPGAHLVDRRAQRVQVGALVCVFTLREFGSHALDDQAARQVT